MHGIETIKRINGHLLTVNELTTTRKIIRMFDGIKNEFQFAVAIRYVALADRYGFCIENKKTINQVMGEAMHRLDIHWHQDIPNHITKGK